MNWFMLAQVFLFSRCARSINLVDLFLWDCPGAGTENLVDFSKVSLAARDGLVYAGAGLFVLPLREIHKSDRFFPMGIVRVRG